MDDAVWDRLKVKLTQCLKVKLNLCLQVKLNQCTDMLEDLEGEMDSIYTSNIHDEDPSAHQY